ncbi:MAG: hypothetical protein BroJett029_20760 [Alphaproteobacteria bacterium]|nr:MAG: hypothetical protein BroJett029_20760 [Alphaproteobacteria bacterium]
MDKARAGVEAEAKETHLPRYRLERHWTVVHHGDAEGGAVEVLRAGCAADGTVVFGAAIGRADDQRLAQPVAERLQLVECITLENNGKIRPQPNRETPFARASGGGDGTDARPSPGL